MGGGLARLGPGLRAVLAMLVCLVGPAPVWAATVLTYHGFDHSRSRISITPEAFEAQLKFLKDNGYNVISMDEMAGHLDARRPFPPKTVVITVDDGWKSIMAGFALLKKYDFPFTLFLPTAYLANPASPRTLSAEDMAELKAWPKTTFASHSHGHERRLSRGGDYAARDVERNKARFRELFGADTPYFAFPYGRGASDYADILTKAGFRYLFVVGGRSFDEKVDPKAIPRLGGHGLSVRQLQELLQ